MIDWNRRAYSQEAFIEAWSSSVSIAECARKLNLTIYGTTYKNLRQLAEHCGLNEDHMLGKSSTKGKIVGGIKAKPIEEHLVYGSPISSSSLKKKLFKSGLKQEKCEECGIVDWNGNSLSFHLEHANGDNKDNRLENLKILCPNCHSQTDTYCRRKSKGQTKLYTHKCVICGEGCRYTDYWHKECITCIDCGQPCKGLRCASCNGKYQGAKFKYGYNKNRHVTKASEEEENLCVDCGIAIHKRSKRCKSCAGKVTQQAKIVWPSDEELLDMLRASNYSRLGKQLGVTDNAIRKHISNRGYNPKTLEKLPSAGHE
jgi:hypothetical protein